MPNFFRDTNVGFKPRTNIFSKLKSRDPQAVVGDEGEHVGVSKSNPAVITADDLDSSMDDSVFSYNEDNTTNTQHTSCNKTDKGKLAVLEETQKVAQHIVPVQESVHNPEEDLEITEIRDVEVQQENTVSSGTPSIRVNHTGISRSNDVKRPLSGPSSNDVLLEAFTNTQKICSSLKIELQGQKNDNQKLKTRLKFYETEITRIRGSLADYRSLLNDLQEKSLEIQKKKITDGNILIETRRKQQNMIGQLTKYQKEIGELKDSVFAMNKVKHALDTELLKKDKDLEYIRQELDDCSGQLTEEKMRNSSLLQEITSSRQQTEAFVQKCFEEIITEAKLNSENINKSLNTSFTEQFSDLEKLHNKLGSTLRTDSIQMIEATLKGDIATLFENESRKHTKDVMSLENKLTDNNGNIKLIQEKSDENVTRIISSIIKEINLDSDKSSVKFDNICDAIITVNKEGTSAVCEVIKVANDKQKNAQHYQEQVLDLEKKLISLEQQKTECLVNLGTKTAEYEDLQNKLNENNVELSKTKSTELKLKESNKRLGDELAHFQVEHRNQIETALTKNNDLENKLECQINISDSLAAETESLKQTVKKLESEKQECEVEKSARVERFQQLNEQVQILNLDMIQLKAHELELEEENKNLTRRVHDNLSNSAEICDEVKILRQKMIESESEKQLMLSEKLDTEAKFHNLRTSIQTLRKQNTSLEKELAESKKNKNSNNITGPKETKLHASTESSYDVYIQKQPLKAAQPSATSKEHKPSVKLPFKCPRQLTGDEFDLSSSSNDDLELTNPSPVQLNPIRTKTRDVVTSTTATHSRKKKLLLEAEGATNLPAAKQDLPRRKKRKNL